MNTTNVVEITLINGKHILIEKNWDKIRRVCEAWFYQVRFSKRFPFISIIKKPCTSFRFRTHYETIDDIFDPTYKADCTLLQLAALFGVDVTPFEKVCIDKDLS